MSGSPEELIATVVETVADNAETPIEDLPLLTNTIDPDALDAFVPADPASSVTVTFMYAGRRVLVHSDHIGHMVYVQPINAGPQGPSSTPSTDE